MDSIQLLKETELQYVDKDIKEVFEKLGYLNYCFGEPTKIQLNRVLRELTLQLKIRNDRT